MGAGGGGRAPGGMEEGGVGVVIGITPAGIMVIDLVVVIRVAVVLEEAVIQVAMVPSVLVGVLVAVVQEEAIIRRRT